VHKEEEKPRREQNEKRKRRETTRKTFWRWSFKDKAGSLLGIKTIKATLQYLIEGS
jgi:hypothetical protein